MTHAAHYARVPNDPPQTTGCAYPDARRPDGLCGKEPVAFYTNPFSRALNTKRCAKHDRDISVRRAAAEMGYHRVPVTESKAERIAAVERVERAV